MNKLMDLKANVHLPVRSASWWRLGPLENADIFPINALTVATATSCNSASLPLGHSGGMPTSRWWASPMSFPWTDVNGACSRAVLPTRPLVKAPHGISYTGTFLLLR